MTPEFEALLRDLPRCAFEPRGSLLSPSEMAGRGDVPPEILPESYLAFVSIVGPGSWTNESGVVMSPGELYAFDADCWEAEGLVALVENADGVGDYIAVNPADLTVEGERPVYYVGHDPMSIVRAADSFEAWVRESATAPVARGLYRHGRRYRHLDVVRDASYARYCEWEKHQRRAAQGPKRWWQFWR